MSWTRELSRGLSRELCTRCLLDVTRCLLDVADAEAAFKVCRLSDVVDAGVGPKSILLALLWFSYAASVHSVSDAPW